MSYITEIDMLPDADSQFKAITEAFNSYYNFKDKATNTNQMLVVDFTQPSWKKRMYLVDLATSKVLRSHHVAHGEGSSEPSDKARAIYFSNINNSHKSCLGAMLTGITYNGKHGRSRRLVGLEPGVNDNVFKRAIVIHRSLYVTDNYVLGVGRAGCSWGCLACDPAICDDLLDLTPEGTFVYCYGVNQDG